MPEATEQKKFSCPTCDDEMIQKSRASLVVVGLCMIASVAIAFTIPLFWAPGISLAKVSGSAPAPGAADDALVVGTLRVDSHEVVCFTPQGSARGRTELQPGRLCSHLC